MSSHYFFPGRRLGAHGLPLPSLSPINTSCSPLHHNLTSPSPLHFIPPSTPPSLRPDPILLPQLVSDIDMERSQCNKQLIKRRGGRVRQRRRREVARHVTLRRKVRELQRLVPGGQDAPADQLLVRTADYIQQLRLRIILLRTLSKLYVA